METLIPRDETRHETGFTRMRRDFFYLKILNDEIYKSIYSIEKHKNQILFYEIKLLF